MTILDDNATDAVEMTTTLAAFRLTISGRVQGVGLRPAISRLAQQLGLAGEVSNTSAGVVVVVEGPQDALASFGPLLRERLPPEAKIRRFIRRPIAIADRRGFRILPASKSGSLRTQVPPDRAICPSCLTDVSEAGGRRHDYPFASCSDCGPRYSIIGTLPFERSATSMREFELCGACREEYGSAADRRFHAQTIACAACGPQCWFTEASSTLEAKCSAAIDVAAAAIRAGRIVALKGLGGYQLLVDATNPEAVNRLRQRKGRPEKPLAVLVSSLAVATSLAELDDAACEGLTNLAGPIVVAPVLRGAMLAPGVCRGLDCVGLMLPTTGLHWLLARQCPPLVATSGNREGEPLAWDENDAQSQLSEIADCFLHHNRPILRPIDDSVVRVMAARQVTIRAARGLAPMPLEIPAAEQITRHVLAVGGHQKVALALHNGSQTVLGPHLGDLDELSTRDRFAAHVRDFCRLFDARPELVVHDAHPNYFTTRWAAEQGLPVMSVQHHHAHVVAGMIEHGWLDREVLGVAWDGTGHGPDGTVWGGEFLRTTAGGYRRVARLRPFPLIGGEAAIREPWRGALAVLRDTIGAEEALRFLSQRGYPPTELRRLLSVPARSCHAPLTSSAGRLFDAIAACLLPLDDTSGGRSQYEGQFAMLLEAACAGIPEAGGDCAPPPAAYRLPIVPGEPNELDWRPLVAALVADISHGVTPALLARRFHASLAEAIAEVSSRHESLPVVLAGGVFQNRLLTELTARRFPDRPQLLGLPGVIPTNDGGLAAGQLAVTLARLALPESTGSINSAQLILKG